MSQAAALDQDLIEKFKRICVDDSPSEYLTLTPEQCVLFEQFKADLVAY